MNDTFASLNPFTNEILWQGKAAGAATIDTAVTQARHAFTTWSQISIEERAGYLKAFQEELKNSRDAFAEIISREMGKPLWESRGEVNAMIGKVDISIEAQMIRCGNREKALPNANSVTRHKPHGVIAVLGPFNFPGHLPNGHIVPALLAGNTVVFKPSELTPWTGEFMCNLWHKAGLPVGVLNLVQGGAESGRCLAEHPGIDGLFFTGSWRTGKRLSEFFGSKPDKILALEMGGNNPLVIWDVKDLEAAAYHTIQSAFLTSGQRCTCARRLIIAQGEAGERFLGNLKEMTAGICAGPYNAVPEPFMGPLVSNAAADTLLEAQKNLIDKGGIPLLAMERKSSGIPLLSPGLIDVTDVAERPDAEYFGPLLQIMRVADFPAAIAEANRTAYGLAAGILTDDENLYPQFYAQIRAGVVNWNTPTTGAASSAPFGGIGWSGNHRPSAYYAADYCNFPVASMEAKQMQIPDTPVPGISCNTRKGRT